jgi:hypothetical protein
MQSYFKTFIPIILVCAFLVSFSNSLYSNEKIRPEVIKPIRSNDTSNFYIIERLQFELPKHFIVTKSNGPDFSVYTIKYPAGIWAGLAFSEYPDLPPVVSGLVQPEVKYRWTPEEIMAEPQMAEPYIQLSKTGHYIEEYELQDYDFEIDSIIILDHYIVEGFAEDSLYVWYNYPTDNRFGKVDVVIDDNSEFAWYPHLFTYTNRYLSWEKVKEFSNQLVESVKNAP